MAIVLSPADLDLLRREADIAAARLVRQFLLPRHERHDLRQDLLVDLIIRLKAFDPTRGTLGAFVGTVVVHQAGRLANRIRRERAMFPPISLDDQHVNSGGLTLGDTIAEADGYAALMGQPADRYAGLERRLDFQRALSSLEPSNLRLCTGLVDRSPTELSQLGIGGRASVYRQVREVRLQLLAAGISAGP